MNFPTRAQVEALRKQYPAGTRIRLISTDDPYTAAKPGDTAVVMAVDDAGQLMLKWDLAKTSISLIPGVDRFEVVEKPKSEKPTIRFNRRGESGNIFWILRALVDECKRMGIEPTVYKGMQERVLAAESYEDALAIISGKVNLIDETPAE